MKHVCLCALLLYTIHGSPLFAHDNAASDTVRYVSVGGSDSNPGTIGAPWRTIQKAANSAAAGMKIYVRAGVYNEAVTVNISGSDSAGSIIFQPYPGEAAVVDGTGLTVPSSASGLFLIQNQHAVIIQGFELRNYKTSTKNMVPVGIYLTGTSHHIQLRNNKIHHIEHNGTSSSGTDAHGIAVYGTSATQSINNIIIDGNELDSLKLGSSESLVLNGNVDTFQVTNNIVHNNNNIGIDAIGFEGTSSDTATDQARNGVISGNIVYRIDSYGNVAYGSDRSADGIYVDGGRNIIIERNIVHHCNIGIELASEHAGRSTSGITMRDNFIYRNDIAGVSIGGYDTKRGSTQQCFIVNNTLFQNDTLQNGNGELYVQYDTRNNIIENNIMAANSQNTFITNDYTQNTGNVVDYNLYFGPGGTANSSWEWKKTYYSDFASYQTGTGNDAHSRFLDPQFVSTVLPDLHLKATSPAIGTGLYRSEAGTYDIDGEPRVNGAIDIGADEFTTSISGIMTESKSTPTAWKLQAYPNPFNPATTISFSLPARAAVSLKIYDLTGREITTLVAEELPAGNYSRQWNANRLSSGVYLYRLQTGMFSETKKLLLIK